VASLLITTLSSIPISSNQTPSPTRITAFLCKSKAALLEHMKSMPDAHVAKEEDFAIWGRQFVDIVVSHKLIGGVDVTDADIA
jgi:hypothetical protein